MNDVKHLSMCLLAISMSTLLYLKGTYFTPVVCQALISCKKYKDESEIVPGAQTNTKVRDKSHLFLSNVISTMIKMYTRKQEPKEQ